MRLEASRFRSEIIEGIILGVPVLKMKFFSLRALLWNTFTLMSTIGSLHNNALALRFFLYFYSIIFRSRCDEPFTSMSFLAIR